MEARRIALTLCYAFLASCFHCAQELYLVKACRVNFNHSDIICQNLTRANQTKIEMEVEMWMSQVQVGFLRLARSPPVIFQELPVADGDRIQEVTQANTTTVELWAGQIKVPQLYKNIISCVQGIVLTDDVNKTGMNNLKDEILNVTTENYKGIQIEIQKWVAEIQVSPT